MKSYKGLLLISIYCFCFIFAGTDGTIRGRVTDEESIELPGATIYLPELGLGAAADPSGNFIILNKTLEGSISFFIISVIVLSAFGFSSETILYVSIFCTLIELISNKIKIDDNLLVPLSSAILLFIF